MSSTPPPLNILRFTFDGLQVIEASAGTGKTWTLAMLYLRLLLGAGPGGQKLVPPQILVMTFTEAATQELRDRIRLRIGEAVAVFRQLPAAANKAHDATLCELRDARPRDVSPDGIGLASIAPVATRYPNRPDSVASRRWTVRADSPPSPSASRTTLPLRGRR